MKYQLLHRIHKLQPLDSKIVMSISRIFLLKIAKDDDSLVFLDNFAHRCGPKYLIECFPNLGKLKSEFLELYFLLLRLNRSQRQLCAILCFMLYISIGISCSLLLFRDGRFALTNSCSYMDVFLRMTVTRAFSPICSSFLCWMPLQSARFSDNMLSVVILKTYRY